jgi:hypothetical protein
MSEHDDAPFPEMARPGAARAVYLFLESDRKWGTLTGHRLRLLLGRLQSVGGRKLPTLTILAWEAQ